MTLRIPGSYIRVFTVGLYVDEDSNRIVILHEIKNFKGKIAVFRNIMTISIDLAISTACQALSQNIG